MYKAVPINILYNTKINKKGSFSGGDSKGSRGMGGNWRGRGAGIWGGGVGGGNGVVEMGAYVEAAEIYETQTQTQRNMDCHDDDDPQTENVRALTSTVYITLFLRICVCRCVAFTGGASVVLYFSRLSLWHSTNQSLPDGRIRYDAMR